MKKKGMKRMYPNVYGDNVYLSELRNFFFRVLGMMDVTFYGAIGDGRTDNYANLQVAIDDANRRGLHYIYVPFGRYCFSGELINMEHIRFVGNPQAQIINLRTHEKIKVYQFGVCPACLSITEPIVVYVKNSTDDYIYLKVTKLDGTVQILRPHKDNKFYIISNINAPLSDLYSDIRLVIGSNEDYAIERSFIIPEDIELEIIKGTFSEVTYYNVLGPDLEEHTSTRISWIERTNEDENDEENEEENNEDNPNWSIDNNDDNQDTPNPGHDDVEET
jgi:hypothetical protein